MSTCQAYQVGDDMRCVCGLQWDVKDDDRPTCKPILVKMTHREWVRKLVILNRAVSDARNRVRGGQWETPERRAANNKAARDAEDALSAHYRVKP